MAWGWVVPEHSRGAVDRAGATLIAPSASAQERREAIAVMNNWRAAHALPLNAIQMNLRNYARAASEEAFVAQRLKRRESIEAKLSRGPNMRLSQMQDVGGCRAVVPSSGDVGEVFFRFAHSRAKHDLIRADDYLAQPRDSGYRGIHLVYRYRTASERNQPYDGLRVEVQLRSQLQHAWATAVETVGLFSRQALKSNEGEEAWLRLFALMGSEVAATEGTPLVPGTPSSDRERRRELKALAQDVDAVNRLLAYGGSLHELEGAVRNGRAEYFHLVLDLALPESPSLFWNEYSATEGEEAARAYGEVESATVHLPHIDTVLVRVASVEALRRAYPNYFADTHTFVEELRRAVG